MVRINVIPLAGAPNYRFEVTVNEGSGDRSKHTVIMKQADFSRLAASRPDAFVSPEHVVETSFRFLLERESKESILPKFNLMVIERYFPDFQRVVSGML